MSRSHRRGKQKDRTAQRARQMRAYYKWRDEAIRLLGGRCADCGRPESETWEIDHMDRSTKVFDILGPRWSCSRAKRLAELKKCQLLCHLCHVDKTNMEKRVRYLDDPPF
jgi:hypothetical protein